ncbi:hypothetical protein [Actinomadura macrotermitis]|uniref:Uncharacterized protein n=1 Tax=Actinomadura macrotermitis TaxID=2585200 RepID=A0A7K0BSH5_9ACTN|nr:hypothetical protein [Actinomadura macrotermitis]MQY04097.1 hypothetical protein [Actinomadura macrotermitis]
MVATKVDVRAVQGELARISALVSGVARQMGPQTWQGGSAGRFTVDLQGHSRSLEQMMARVLQAVAAMNELPMVIDVPEIAAVPLQPPAGLFNQVASVSVAGLQRMEIALRRAADALPDHGRRVRALLSQGGPVEVSTAQCDRTAAWCAAQVRATKTRIHYALASDNVGITWGMAGIPDVDKFGAAQMAELARHQVQAYAKALESSDAGAKQLLADIAASLRENGKDTAYLTAFFGAVQPGSVGELAYNLHRQSGGAPLAAADKKILADVGTALAQLSRQKDGQAAVWRAMGGAGSDMPGQALLVKLAAPEVKWSSAMLLELGKAALRWRQQYPSYELTTSGGSQGEKHTSVTNQPHRAWWKDWGINGGTGLGDADLKSLREHDPALNILGRIAQQQDTTAARDLASTKLEKAFTIKDADKAKALTWVSRGNGETYAALLIAPDWTDGGDLAGKVVRLAVTQEKGHEEQAAENAAEIMKTVAWWNEKGRSQVDKLLNEGHLPKWVPWLHRDGAPGWFADSKQYSAEYGRGLTNGLLQMTRMYIPTLAYADRTSNGASADVDPATGRTFVTIDGDDAVQFLRTFAADDKLWTQLGIDTQHYKQKLYAWGLRDHSLLSAARYAGFLDGNLIRAYGKERITREELTKQQYEAAQERLALLRDLGGTILGETPAGQIPGVSDAYGMGTDLGLDKVKYADFEKKLEAIDKKHADYSSQLYVDLARAYRAQLGSPLVGAPEIDALLAKPKLSEEQIREVVQWTRHHVFVRGGNYGDGMGVTGGVIVGWSVDGLEHNAPQKD